MAESLEQLPSIQVKSPLAIVGAFLYLIRDRFAPDNNLPWRWLSDSSVSDVVIEAQYNRNTEASDPRPGIFVDKEQTSYGKVTVGNQDQNQPKIIQGQLVHYISFAQTDLTIDCVSTSRGESMQLADIVQAYLESSKYIIMQVFGFRDISPIVVNRTQPFQKQTDLHQTSLNFRVEYEVRWATMPAAPALRRIGAHLTENKASGGVNTLLADVYLKSIDVAEAPAPTAPTLNTLPQITCDTVLTVTGTLAVGESVQLIVDDVAGDPIAVIDGMFTAELTLDEGTHTVSARASNLYATTQTVIIDRTAPPAPTILSPGTTTVDTDVLTLTGFTEPNATVVVAIDGLDVATVLANSDGQWVVNSLKLPT
jgi:hypothetical protein